MKSVDLHFYKLLLYKTPKDSPFRGLNATAVPIRPAAMQSSLPSPSMSMLLQFNSNGAMKSEVRHSSFPS